ncbi:uncharacterized protein LOC119105332 [Pollicipes pollicipes]|uniref:uncharacterized protein LOC119105332 n=1 Tax=Pollicipes pollicipes TaxID=41117 RepID=UPI001884C501|nr:uncharacterized protein LOC119105332 [Pollicipes pollicipes]
MSEPGAAPPWSGPVTITEATAPNKIWATPASVTDDTRFMKIKQQMVEVCTKQRHHLKMESNVKQGEVYVYHPPATNRWYRVRVLARFRSAATPCCSVLLLDDGERKTVADCELYRLPEPFCDLRQLPPQALRLRLAGVVPVELVWRLDDAGAVQCHVDRAAHWSEAACLFVSRQLTPGTLCRLRGARE